MAHGSWGSGWPNCQVGQIKRDFSVDGTSFPGGVRHELVDLLTRLVRETKRRGYQFGRPGDPSYGCWGFSCRAIAGTSTPSNHSWGLAVDINAPSNPWSSRLITNMPGWMPDLWNDYGFRWGGDYSGKKDAMHYEYMGSVGQAAAHTAKAANNNLGGGGAAPTQPPRVENRPGTPAFPLNTGYYFGPLSGPKESISGMWKGDTEAARNGIRVAQHRLNAHLRGSGAPTISEDGQYGPKTQAAVRWYQQARHQSHGLAVDGLLGRKTWDSLWT